MQAVDHRFVAQPFSRRRKLIGTAVMAIIVLTAVIAFNALRTPVDGYLILGTHFDDHNSEIYVGDRFVGIGCAKITWAEILGWQGHEPLAIILPNDAPWPPSPSVPPPLTAGEATAERLAGKGATVLHFEAGSPPLFRYGDRHRLAQKEMLIRRADGILDHVFCLDAVFTDVLGGTYRALVPIRVRLPDSHHSGFFSSSSNYATYIERDGDKVVSFGPASVPRNGWLHRYSHDWGFQSVDPPAEFTDEIRKRGLWTPGA